MSKISVDFRAKIANGWSTSRYEFLILRSSDSTTRRWALLILFSANAWIDDPPSHLLIILETHPAPYATTISLPVLLSTLLLLVNAHLSLSHQNIASFIASTPRIARFLYPTSPAESVVHSPASTDPQNNSMYRAFNQIKSHVTRNLQHLLSHESSTKPIPNGTQLAGALSLGLTYINRLQINSPLSPPSARIYSYYEFYFRCSKGENSY